MLIHCWSKCTTWLKVFQLNWGISKDVDKHNNKHSNLYFVEKYACIFVLGHYMFLKVFLKFPYRKTVPILKQTMSPDLYLCILLCHIERIINIYFHHLSSWYCLEMIGILSSHSWELKGLFPLVIAIKLSQI